VCERVRKRILLTYYTNLTSGGKIRFPAEKRIRRATSNRASGAKAAWPAKTAAPAPNLLAIY
jgi:hypothetical protein